MWRHRSEEATLTILRIRNLIAFDVVSHFHLWLVCPISEVSLRLIIKAKTTLRIWMS